MSKIYLLALLTAIFLANPLLGQTEAEQAERPRQRQRPDAGAEYEHLKVLEPLLGTFSLDPGEGSPFLLRKKHEWSQNKRMIVGSLWIKPKESDQEFIETKQRQAFYWNATEQRIEHVAINPQSGRVDTYAVTPKEDNEFGFELINTSRPGHGAGFIDAWAVTDKGINIRGGSRPNSEGIGRQIRRELTRIE